MDRIRELLNRPVGMAVVGGIVGLILGLLVGWVIWPVQYTGAAPVHMAEDYQEEYLRMAIDSFAANGDKTAALNRWQDLGDQAEATLTRVQLDPGTTNPSDIARYSAAVQGSAAAPAPAATQPAAPGGQQATAEPGGGATAAVPGPVATEEPAAASGPQWSLILGILCLVMLAIAGAAAYIFVFRNRRPSFLTPAGQAQEANRAAVKTEYPAEGQEAPVAQFMTTYMAGDDLYDDSFSIDAPTGEFLGECGVGISDTIGVGDPKKVTAFEVWLFDKNDIQTVTKVLMSEHAFNDAAIRQRLATKGEPVLIDPAERVLLETATLVLEARVVDANYGSGALPPNSYFDRLTLELAVWPKTPVA